MEQNANKQGHLSQFVSRMPSVPTFEGVMDKCLHSGYLYEKRSGQTADWKKKWFVLKDSNLYYFTSYYSLFADGVIPVDACLANILEDGETTPDFNGPIEHDLMHSTLESTMFEERPSKNNGTKYQFTVSHPLRKTIYLCAESQNEMNEWIEAFNSVWMKEQNQLMGEVDNLIAEKEYLKAREKLDILIAANPNNSLALQKRGIVGFVLYNYAETLEYLNKADSLDPNNSITLKYRGAAKRCIDVYRGAIEDLNKADELQPNDVFTLYNRGRTKYWKGAMKEAMEDYDKVIELQPDHAEAFYWRALAKRSRNKLRGAHEDLDKARELNIVRKFMQRAVEKEELGDWRGALEDINRAQELEPNILLETSNIRGYCPEDIPTEVEPGDLSASSCNNTRVEGVVDNSVDKLTGISEVPFSELSIIEPIGSGGYGEVSTAWWRGLKVAIKQLKSNMVAHIAMHEAKILVLLRCKYIVTLMGITTNPATNHIVMIMEYMKHGSLDDLLFARQVTLSRDEVIGLALDIAKGVNFLHSYEPKILHRDLKSANVLLYETKQLRAKIVDFGFAKYLPSNTQTDTVLGGGYHVPLPPEMEAERPYNEKVDVFMFGVVLFEMLTNKRMRRMEESYRQAHICDVITNSDFASLVVNCCVSDPIKRLSMSQVIDVLKKMKHNK